MIIGFLKVAAFVFVNIRFVEVAIDLVLVKIGFVGVTVFLLLQHTSAGARKIRL